MQVLFADALPKGPYDLALLAPQNGDISGMPAAHAGLVRDAIKATRFESEAGGLVEIFVIDEGTPRRLLVVGIGKGEAADYEKAGGALVARLLTSGTATLAVDLGGGCRFPARFDGSGIAFPGALPDACAGLCTGRATLAGLSVDALSNSLSEAVTLTDARGRALCAPSGD